MPLEVRGGSSIRVLAAVSNISTSSTPEGSNLLHVIERIMDKSSLARDVLVRSCNSLQKATNVMSRGERATSTKG